MSFFSLDNPAVILETVKMVWDTVLVGKTLLSHVSQVELVGTTRAIVLRMYESFGSHTGAILTSKLPFTAYQR